MAFYRCGGGLPTQQKNNEVAKTTNLIVTPDDGYVLEKVTVAPTPSEPGSATAPLSGSVEYPAPSGKYFNKFTVTATPSTSSYEITAGTSDKTITPPSGSLISGGTVHPTPSYQGTGTAPLTGTSSAITPTSGNHFSSFKITATPSVSDYSITAGTTSKAITHPTGKLIFGGTVNPTPTEKGSDIAPVSGTKECTPTEGKFFSDFTISAPPTETVSVTASTTDIPLTASSGTLISGGTVHPTPSSQGSGKSPVSGTQTFTPTSGQLFSSFKVTAPTTETKTIIAGTVDVPFTASSGKLISGGTVQPTPSEPGSATATTSAQTKTPSSGKLFSSFTINPQQHSLTYGSGTNQIVLPDVHNYKTINYDNKFKSDCIWLSPPYSADSDEYVGQTVQIGYVENSSFSNLNDIYVSAYELFRQNSYGWTKSKPSFKSNFSLYQYDLIVIAYLDKLDTILIDPDTEYDNTMKFYYFSPKDFRQYIHKQTHSARYTELIVSGVCASLVSNDGSSLIRIVTINDSNSITFSDAKVPGELITDNSMLLPVAIFGIQRDNAIGISANCLI